MMDNTQKFCDLIKSRSNENKESITLLAHNNLFGNCISILRQELDSMVRVIYLIAQDQEKRENLINRTLNGQRWNITDRNMVDLADRTHGWTKSVYKFGCSFIHLSQFHGYIVEDPFAQLSEDEIFSIRDHLHHYHSFPTERAIKVDTISPYLIRIFEKISGNLSCYLANLSGAGTIKDLI